MKQFKGRNFDDLSADSIESFDLRTRYRIKRKENNENKEKEGVFRDAKNDSNDACIKTEENFYEETARIRCNDTLLISRLEEESKIEN